MAAPLRVVHADDELLVTWLAPRTPYMRPAVRAALPFGQPLVNRPWKAPGVLQVTPRRAAHSIWIFRDAWYVNLQEPLRPTPLGADTRDQLLDVVRYRAGGWRLKDVDELEAAVAAGHVPPDEAAAIHAEAERVIATDPFPTGWERWRADPRWPVPELPEGWDVL